MLEAQEQIPLQPTMPEQLDDTKLGEAADTPGDCAAIQGDLSWLEKWLTGAS